MKARRETGGPSPFGGWGVGRRPQAGKAHAVVDFSAR